MTRWTRLSLIIATIALIGIVTIILIQRLRSPQTMVNGSVPETPANSSALAKLLSSASQKIIVRLDGAQLALVDTSLAQTANLASTTPGLMSNTITADTTIWLYYDYDTAQLYRQTVGQTTLLGQIHHVPSRSILALQPNGNSVVWISGDAPQQQLMQYDIVTGQETVLFQTTPDSSITAIQHVAWSTTNDRLAITDQQFSVHILSTAGAELQSPLPLASASAGFTIDQLFWLQRNQLAAMVTMATSSDPELIVFNLDGTVTEHHQVFAGVGIPTVTWAPDSNFFTFYHPWKNQLMIYDRFSRLRQTIPTTFSSKITVHGWTPGEAPAAWVTSILDTPTSTPTTATTEPFSLTAEEWEHYNQTVRSIIGLYQTDFSSYRFSQNDQGIAVTISLPPQTDRAELVFLELIGRIFVVLPELPSLDLTVNSNEDSWTIQHVTPTLLSNATTKLTGQALDKILTSTPEAPLGFKVPKPDQPQYNYFTDLVYASDGTYNPIPVFALLDVASLDLNDTTWQFIQTDYYASKVPAVWRLKRLADIPASGYKAGDIVLFEPETSFPAEDQWVGFAVSLQQYDIPDITVEQWIQVNRPDTIAEPIQVSTRQPVTVRKLTLSTSTTDLAEEYVMYTPGRIYLLKLERPTGITEADRLHVSEFIKYFTDLTSFHS